MAAVSEKQIPSHIHAGVIINPRSGSNRRSPVDIEQLSSQFGIPVREAATPVEVNSAVEEFSKQKVNVIVVCGGDGTVQAAHTSLFSQNLFDVLPSLVVVGAGTTNMTAGDVGVRERLPDVLQKITNPNDARHLKLITRKILKLDMPGEPSRYGMFFTTAAICDAMLFYHSKLHGRGFWGLPGIILTFLRFVTAALAGRSGPGRETWDIKVRLNHEPAVRENFMILMATTLDKLIFGIKPFKKEKGRGKLRFTALAMHPVKLWRELPGLLSGNPSKRAVRQNGYWLERVDRVVLEVNGIVALDGEMYSVNSMDGAVTLTSAGTCSFIRW